MSDLISIAYPDELAARHARTNLATALDRGSIAVEDIVVILHEEDSGIVPVLSGWQDGVAAAGSGLIGLILLGPLLGMAFRGGVADGAGDRTIFERFAYELRDSLAPGNAALVVLVRDLTPQQVLPHLHEPGHVVHVSLPDEVEAQLDAARGSGRK